MIMWLMSTAETLIFVAPVFGRLAGCSIEWNCAPDSTRPSVAEIFAIDHQLWKLRRILLLIAAFCSCGAAPHRRVSVPPGTNRGSVHER
jgi:hypothetical protein